jgi:hypothetical protein
MLKLGIGESSICDNALLRATLEFSKVGALGSTLQCDDVHMITPLISCPSI